MVNVIWLKAFSPPKQGHKASSILFENKHFLPNIWLLSGWNWKPSDLNGNGGQISVNTVTACLFRMTQMLDLTNFFGSWWRSTLKDVLKVVLGGWSEQWTVNSEQWTQLIIGHKLWHNITSKAPLRSYFCLKRLKLPESKYIRYNRMNCKIIIPHLLTNFEKVKKFSWSNNKTFPGPPRRLVNGR